MHSLFARTLFPSCFRIDSHLFDDTFSNTINTIAIDVLWELSLWFFLLPHTETHRERHGAMHTDADDNNLCVPSRFFVSLSVVRWWNSKEYRKTLPSDFHLMILFHSIQFDFESILFSFKKRTKTNKNIKQCEKSWFKRPNLLFEES